MLFLLSIVSRSSAVVETLDTPRKFCCFPKTVLMTLALPNSPPPRGGRKFVNIGRHGTHWPPTHHFHIPVKVSFCFRELWFVCHEFISAPCQRPFGCFVVVVLSQFFHFFGKICLKKPFPPPQISTVSLPIFRTFSACVFCSVLSLLQLLL